MRFNANGTPDTGFGQDGVTRFSRGVADEANAVALQPDGKVLVVGTDLNNITGHDFALVRLNANGSLDSTFVKAGWC